jgi:membrane protein YqaA with SNARE-associated domain
MRRTVESPDPPGEILTAPTAPPRAEPLAAPDAAPPEPPPDTRATCESVPATAESAAVEVADETGAHLVPTTPTPPANRCRAALGVVVGALILGGLSAAFVLYPIDWNAVGQWGYLGVFGVVFVATASVALPIPYLLIVARAGSFLDPWMIALVAGVAGMLGELAGYLIGVGGSGLVPHGRMYERARQWICGSGFWCIALFACVPNPFFDAIGVVAGTLRYSWWRFSLACFIGKAIKFLIAALVGIEIVRHGWLG